MRAYMSDETRRPVAGRVDRLRFSPQSEQFVSASAVIEARRILAETERPVNWRATGLDATWPPDGFMAAHVSTLREACGAKEAEIGASLAESLARFIALDLE